MSDGGDFRTISQIGILRPGEGGGLPRITQRVSGRQSWEQSSALALQKAVSVLL